MTAQTETDIRRHPDGSIDTDHYIAIGRKEHATAVCAAGRQVARCADLDSLLSKFLRALDTGRTQLVD